MWPKAVWPEAVWPESVTTGDPVSTPVAHRSGETRESQPASRPPCDYSDTTRSAATVATHSSGRPLAGRRRPATPGSGGLTLED